LAPSWRSNRLSMNTRRARSRNRWRPQLLGNSPKGALLSSSRNRFHQGLLKPLLNFNPILADK